MSRYDGLIIPRSYSEYINKTDAATLSQALQLSGVLSGAVAAGDNKAVTSNAVNKALSKYKTRFYRWLTIPEGNSAILDISSLELHNLYIIKICSNNADIWRYCGIIGRSLEYYTLTQLDKGLRLSVTFTDVNTITITNEDKGYEAGLNIEIL